MSRSILEEQNKIVEAFSMLEGDMEMSINYLIELGDTLKKYPDEWRDEDHIVKGCQSKVWMNAELKNGVMMLTADSNTAITKGLVSLLVSSVNGFAPDQILNADIIFPEKIGMNRFIGTQRSNGFSSVIKQIKMYALALSALESK